MLSIRNRWLVVLFSISILGLASSAMAGGVIHFDLSGSAAYSKASGIATPPTLGTMGGGLTAAYNWTDTIFTGLSADYWLISHYSALIDTVGNFRGKRLNFVSPTIGFHLGSLIAKLDFQFLGSYQMTNKSSTGSSLTYKNPLGGRLVASYPFYGMLYLGVFYEHLFFKTKVDSAAGSSTISPKLGLWQVGLNLSFVPWAMTSSY